MQKFALYSRAERLLTRAAQKGFPSHKRRLWCKRACVNDDGQRPRFVLVDELVKGRHFDQEMVALCVRWYLSYKVGYRDLVAMMGERGIEMAHSTILGWVQHYTPNREALEPVRQNRRRLLARRYQRNRTGGEDKEGPVQSRQAWRTHSKHD